ncbi:hypothetical protein Pint_27074 [Pistacia integerrima]|uniref:Uncharacterized protein n=1 Tax=Pistacia integerrima TaxID=434235 RepID=A0ACC0YQ73_9ROSI|nr:hypothetical protein Pint_27074 [Pistacia integerrima]
MFVGTASSLTYRSLYLYLSLSHLNYMKKFHDLTFCILFPCSMQVFTKEIAEMVSINKYYSSNVLNLVILRDKAAEKS